MIVIDKNCTSLHDADKLQQAYGGENAAGIPQTLMDGGTHLLFCALCAFHEVPFSLALLLP